MSHPKFPREASVQRPVILERLRELLLLLAVLLLVIVLLLFQCIRQEPEITNLMAELNIHAKTSCSSRKCEIFALMINFSSS